MNLDSFIEMEKLDNKEIEQVKEYVESLKRSRQKQGNEECPYWIFSLWPALPFLLLFVLLLS